MKAKLFTVLIIAFTSLLTGCLSVERSCGYTKYYNCPYYNLGKCGPRITYRCDQLCDRCSANEPMCTACWTCINADGSVNIYNTTVVQHITQTCHSAYCKRHVAYK